MRVEVMVHSEEPSSAPGALAPRNTKSLKTSVIVFVSCKMR